jgi:glycosyltransferase involved in cell wall biosynthesis
VSRIAAAIPALDAEGSLGDVVKRALSVLPELLVVDDGSRDRTAQVARDAGAEVHRHDRVCGKGAALRTAFGVLFARGCDFVVTLDADGQHVPEEIPKLLASLGSADLVLGTRSHLFGEMSRPRRLANRLSAWAISKAAGSDVSDAQTGFRAYARGLIEATGFPERHFDAESAVLVRAVRLGFRIATVPVDLGFADGRATSHYRPLVDSFRIARAVARARWER